MPPAARCSQIGPAAALAADCRLAYCAMPCREAAQAAASSDCASSSVSTWLLPRSASRGALAPAVAGSRSAARPQALQAHRHGSARRARSVLRFSGPCWCKRAARHLHASLPCTCERALRDGLNGRREGAARGRRGRLPDTSSNAATARTTADARAVRRAGSCRAASSVRPWACAQACSCLTC